MSDARCLGGLPQGGGGEAYRDQGNSGFSLLEVLIVVSIIAIAVALLAPSLSGGARSAYLRRGGDKLSSLIALARQTAMSKNTMTALVMLGEANAPEDFRAFTVLEYGAETGWMQVGGWELLAEGIVVDFTSGESSFLSNSPEPFPLLATTAQENPPVLFRQSIIPEKGGYAARIFGPSGSLRNAEDPAQIRLVEGYKAGKILHYSHRREGGGPADYVDVAIVGATGLAKLSRP